MRLPNFAALLVVTAAWETDDRCPERRLRGHTAGEPRGSVLAVAKGAAVVEQSAHRELESGNLVFHLKMYWEEGFCWQEEWRERRWCLDCNGHDCNLNSILSTQDCAETSMQEFVWIPLKGKEDGRGSLKVANKDLCFERYSNQEYRLQPCSGKDRQMFLGFTYNGPFELHPLFFPDLCISQHHDPKPDEEIYGVSCADAQRDYTNRWEVWLAKKVPSDLMDENFPELASEGISCTPGNPCGLCEGDCDIHTDCANGLECFQRFSTANPWDRIPGCAGEGKKSVDYCYNPEAPSRDGELYKLITLDEDCSSNNPCDKCYGDCDSDDHCVGKLKCYQRTNDNNEWEGVPGCYSLGWRARDYCYDPDDTPGPTPSNTLAPSTTEEMTAVPTPNIFLPMLTHQPTPVPTTSSPIVAMTLKPITASPIAAVTPEPTNASPIVAMTPEPTTAAPIATTTPEPTTASPIAAMTPEPTTALPIPEPTTAQNLPTTAPVSPTTFSDELISLSIDCTTEKGCERCFGDCGSDDECTGDLECFFRSTAEGNSLEPVPGCTGVGIANWDYCYEPSRGIGPSPTKAPVVESPTDSPNDLPTDIPADTPTAPILPTTAPVSPTTFSDELISLSVDCTTEKGCERCFGDCGSDDECTGDLECFFRSTAEGNSLVPVPGCTGVGIANWDYCYEPSRGIGPSPTKAPVVGSPTDSPNDLPTDIPADTPINTPNPNVATTESPESPAAFCLSSESHVTVKRGVLIEIVSMKNLKVGDHVQDGADSFSQVYSFGHYSEHAKTPYFQVHVSGGLDQQPLELSKEHMAFAFDGTVLPASMLSVGDFLSLGNGDRAEILRIHRIVRRGAYAPFTESGKLIVNGLVVSSFVAINPNQRGVNVCGIPVMTFQWLAYVTQTPHRLYSKIFGVDETPHYAKDGLSVWVAAPFEVATWIVRQQEVVQLMILSLTVTALLPMLVLEELLSYLMPVLLCRMAMLVASVFVGAFVNKRLRCALKIEGAKRSSLAGATK